MRSLLTNLLLFNATMLYVLFVHDIYAEASSLCRESLFQCQNNRCISKAYVCDQENDCGDNSDEIFCDANTCSPSQFRCNNGQCINASYKCDKDIDCADMSDEEDICKNVTCKGNMFNCPGDNTCIPTSWKCDDEEDCENGEDEKNCVDSHECPSDHFKCVSSGTCIENEWKCDGNPDCEDGSDEKDCLSSCSDSTKFFQCNKTRECIPISYRCDGNVDCMDASDEVCPSLNASTRKCPGNGFACHAGKPRCIMADWVCDEDADCEDKSDEINCLNSIDHCKPGEFHCNNRRQCISSTAVCDGIQDCNDNSDEEDCSEGDPKRCLPAELFYTCLNSQQCIHRNRLCDKRIDCPHGEDESADNCRGHRCNSTSNKCSQICTEGFNSTVCSCRKGYVLADDKVTCVDFDECKNGTHHCDQKCVNTKASYKCLCYDGFYKERNICKLDSSTSPLLIFSNIRDIRTLVLDKIKVSNVIVEGLNHAVGITTDVHTGTLYWSDIKDETINSIKLHPDSSNVGERQVILSSPTVESVWSLAVDWVHKNLYWSDYDLSTVSVAKTTGKWPKVIIEEAEGWHPNGVTVAPKHGFLFVAVMGTVPAIERYTLAGKARKLIFDRILVLDPTGITYDVQDDLIYWVDEKYQTISACNINGEHYRMVIHNIFEIKYSHGIATFGSNAYWTNHKITPIQTVPKHSNGFHFKPIVQSKERAMDVTIHHKLLQPLSTNYCLQTECKYLCLPNITTNGRNYTCACPDHYISITNDDSDCQAKVVTTTQTVSSTSQPTTTPTSTTSETTASVTQKTETEAQAPSMSTGSKFVIAIITIICILILLFVVCLYQRRKRTPKSVNFDNPVYRKTTTSFDDASGSQSSIQEDTPESSRDNYLDTRSGAILVENEQRTASNSAVTRETTSGNVYSAIATAGDFDDDSITYSDKQGLVSS